MTQNMERIKSRTTEIFKKDFFYYLYDEKDKDIRIKLYVPAVVLIVFYILLDILSYSYHWFKLIPLATIFPFLVTWLVFLFRDRNKRLKVKGETLKDFQNGLLFKGYNKAIDEKIFMDNYYDIELLDELIPLYHTDLEKHKNRFIHSATGITIIIAIISYWVQILFLKKMETFIEGIKLKESSIIMLFVIYSVIFIVVLYCTTIYVCYRKELINKKVYHKLNDLRIELMKKYKWQSSENQNS